MKKVLIVIGFFVLLIVGYFIYKKKDSSSDSGITYLDANGNPTTKELAVTAVDAAGKVVGGWLSDKLKEKFGL